MKLSVVVPTYDRPDDLMDCLRSLRGQYDPPDEIVVVDDGDLEGTQERLREEGLDDVEHIPGKQKGLPAARNQGVGAATGDVVAFVDDDVVAPPNWVREIRATYRRFPDVVGVGGYVLNYNPPDINKANVDSLGYRLLQAARAVFLLDRVGDVSPFGILYAPHVFMTSGPQRVETFQGCNMSFRTDVFETHAFDEWYGTSGSVATEEVDFCSRVSSDCGDLIYHPRVAVLHKRSLSGESDERFGESNHGNITNLMYFVLKHPDMDVQNVLLLIIVLTFYSAVTRDLGYLRAVADGVNEYWFHRVALDSSHCSVGRRDHD